MLAAIPEMIFLIGVERDDYISAVVKVRSIFGGHIYWLSFCLLCISNVSAAEYIENNGQGQKENDHRPKLLGFYSLEREILV